MKIHQRVGGLKEEEYVQKGDRKCQERKRKCIYCRDMKSKVRKGKDREDKNGESKDMKNKEGEGRVRSG